MNFRAKKELIYNEIYWTNIVFCRSVILSLNTWLSIFKVKFAWKCMQLSIHVWIFAPLAKKLSFSSKSIAKKMVSAWGRKWRKKCVNLLIFYLKDIFFLGRGQISPKIEKCLFNRIWPKVTQQAFCQVNTLGHKINFISKKMADVTSFNCVFWALKFKLIFWQDLNKI